MLMDWNKIIESTIGPLLGTLIGGGLTIFSLYFKERFDRKKAVQAWFEEQYIKEGLDPLLHYIELAKVNLMMKQAFGHEVGFAPNKIEQPPSEALLRISSLLGHGGIAGRLIGMVSTVEYVLKTPYSPEMIDSIRECMNALLIHLEMFRIDLTRMRIRRKSDVYNLAHNKAISRIIEFIQHDTEEAFSQLGGRISPTEGKADAINSKRA